MDTATLGRELQECGAVEQGFQIQVVTFADQYEPKTEGLADGFFAVEGEHLKDRFNTVDLQLKTVLAGGVIHHDSPC
ncbi:hypothetical protein PSFL111601_06980 [Pseudomonas floridensis]